MRHRPDTPTPRPTLLRRALIAAMLPLPLLLLAAGCATPERSRQLGNPAIAPEVIARQTCGLCHGTNGRSVSPNVPNLAAQPAGYLEAQLQGFRNHTRQDPAGFEYMWGISHALDDTQIAGLAAYYARQAPPAQPPEGDPARLPAGRRLFSEGAPDRGVPACGSCHGARGEGLANFPRLAGQHADYVAKQLLVFQRTQDRPAGAVMMVVAHGLTADDVADAAAYVQSLP